MDRWARIVGPSTEEVRYGSDSGWVNWLVPPRTNRGLSVGVFPPVLWSRGLVLKLIQ